jgi:SOUL heme-binding protein
MTKQQEFRVLQTYEDFELREYLPCVIAEVKVSANYSTATSSAFSSLFNYISQGNESSQKIAMTAPVITAQKADRSDSAGWYVSFVMPSGSAFDHMPHPNDSQVRLRELDAETCVAKSFRGTATDELSRKKVQELRASASKANIALSDETRICRFDPPFKPGFLQYNEIVIPIHLGE